MDKFFILLGGILFIAGDIFGQLRIAGFVGIICVLIGVVCLGIREFRKLSRIERIKSVLADLGIFGLFYFIGSLLYVRSIESSQFLFGVIVGILLCLIGFGGLVFIGRLDASKSGSEQ